MLKLDNTQLKAVTLLTKHEGQFEAVLSIFESAKAERMKQYATAKELLVTQGDNRPICLQLKGRIDQLDEVIEALKRATTV